MTDAELVAELRDFNRRNGCPEYGLAADRLEQFEAALFKIASYPSGGTIEHGTPGGDRFEMIVLARSTLAGDKPYCQYERLRARDQGRNPK